MSHNTLSECFKHHPSSKTPTFSTLPPLGEYHKTLLFQGTPLQTYVDRKGHRWWKLSELCTLLGYTEKEAIEKTRRFSSEHRINKILFPGEEAPTLATCEEGAFHLAAHDATTDAKRNAFHKWLWDANQKILRSQSTSSLPPLIAHLRTLSEDKETQYGPADIAFGEIAERWSATLKQPITAKQVALCMIDLKMARLSRNLTHKDSLMDIIGYALCYARVQGWD